MRNSGEKVENDTASPSLASYSSSAFIISLAVLFVTLGIFGMINNSIVVLIVWKTKSMHTATNAMLANIAAADILTILWCITLFFINFTGSHPGGSEGSYLCKWLTGCGFSSLTVAASAVSLAIVAIERYRALCHPYHTTWNLTFETVSYAAAVTWILGLCLAIPAILLSRYDEDLQRCLHPWTLELAPTMMAYFTCLLVFFGIPPFSIISFCYFQILKGIYITRTMFAQAPNGREDLHSKRKLAKLSISVTIAFFLCYLPFCVFSYILSFTAPSEIQTKYKTYYILYRILYFLLFLNSSLNPILHAFQSSNYREIFNQIFGNNLTLATHQNRNAEEAPGNLSVRLDL